MAADGHRPPAPVVSPTTPKSSSGRPISVRRRVAVATWRPSKDGRIYTRVEIDATPMLQYVDEARERTGTHVTVTHVIGAALGRAICAVPEVRTRVVFGRIRQSESCDIAFAVDIEGGEDLAPVKVTNADQKTPVDIARELAQGSQQLRSREGTGYARSSSILRRLPWWADRPTLAAAGLLIGGLGIGALGQVGFPLGAAFVTNVGTLGLDEGFIAPLPFARVALYLSVGAVRDAAVVVNGAVVVRPQIVLGATGDHRLIDGAHAGQITATMRELLADPSQLDKPWMA
jgi:pyruvate/2-oxoglutarate dehydrogenase complex dihydrolipoamide acyltransferase (E2) component